MPFVLGPDTYETLTENGLKRRNPVKIELSGTTLGDILSAYRAKYGSTFTPYDGSDPNYAFANDEPKKYFWFTGERWHHLQDKTRVIDIHIIRHKKMICPKQDLSFKILADDLVQIDVPVAC